MLRQAPCPDRVREGTVPYLGWIQGPKDAGSDASAYLGQYGPLVCSATRYLPLILATRYLPLSFSLPLLLCLSVT